MAILRKLLKRFLSCEIDTAAGRVRWRMRQFQRVVQMVRLEIEQAFPVGTEVRVCFLQGRRSDDCLWGHSFVMQYPGDPTLGLWVAPFSDDAHLFLGCCRLGCCRHPVEHWRLVDWWRIELADEAAQEVARG